MRILLFGRGVISTLYGWAFEKAGHSVTFYVRPGRAAEYGPRVRLEVWDGRRDAQSKHFEEDWTIHMVEELPEDHTYDLILISVQEWMFAEVAEFLRARVGHATLLILSGFWHDPQQATRALPHEQLAWGFPFAGGAFKGNILRGAIYGSVFFGTFSPALTDREEAARQLFRDCGLKISEKKNFRDWLWIHFATNAAMMSQAAQAGGIEHVMTSFHRARQTAITLRELIPILRARGVDLRKSFVELLPFRLPPFLFAIGLVSGYALSKPFQTAIGTGSHKEEIYMTVATVLQTAAEFGIDMPRLQQAKTNKNPLLGHTL